jgi:2,5-diketo-D-gluconate reductase A
MDIPAFGLGTYTVQGETCSSIVNSALKIGYRWIDTAELYQNHVDISRGLKSAIENNIVSREDVWLTSKIHNRDQRKLNIGPAIQKIMSDLDVEYLDMILLHSAQKKYLDAYQELIRCKNHFNIRHIGVSNFREDELQTIIDKTGIKPYLNQIEVSPFFQRLRLRSFMTEQQILTQAYASLTCGNGLNSDKLIFGLDSDSGSDPNSDSDPNSEEKYKHKHKPDELLLGWAKYYNLRPIPTAHNLEHLERNFHTLTNIVLDYSEINNLDQITDQIVNYKQHMDKY